MQTLRLHGFANSRRYPNPELVTGARTPDAGVKSAMVKALYEVVSKAGANMGDPSKASILGLIEEDLEVDDGNMIPPCAMTQKAGNITDWLLWL